MKYATCSADAHLKPMVAPVAGAGRLAVDRLADAEGAAVMAVEEACVSGRRLVDRRLARAQHAEHRVVKRLARLRCRSIRPSRD